MAITPNPNELLEELAALTPRPRINLVLYHGVLGPHSRMSAHAPSPMRLRRSFQRNPAVDSAAPYVPEPRGAAPGKLRYWAWADHLMRRAFDLDVLACPRCVGRMRLLATIEDPQVIRKILAHPRLPTEVPRPRPSRPPPARAADPFSNMPA